MEQAYAQALWQLIEGGMQPKKALDAMVALLTAYPEMRKSFHGVWVLAEVPGQQNPFATEQAMSEIH